MAKTKRRNVKPKNNKLLWVAIAALAIAVLSKGGGLHSPTPTPQATTPQKVEVQAQQTVLNSCLRVCEEYGLETGYTHTVGCLPGQTQVTYGYAGQPPLLTCCCYDITQQTDSDGDGIPDSADPDDDNDGFTDDEEILGGTNPKDPNDHPNPVGTDCNSLCVSDGYVSGYDAISSCSYCLPDFCEVYGSALCCCRTNGDDGGEQSCAEKASSQGFANYITILSGDSGDCQEIAAGNCAAYSLSYGSHNLDGTCCLYSCSGVGETCVDSDVGMSGLESLQTPGYCQKGVVRVDDGCIDNYRLKEAVCVNGNCVDTNILDCRDFFVGGFCSGGKCRSCNDLCVGAGSAHGNTVEQAYGCVLGWDGPLDGWCVENCGGEGFYDTSVDGITNFGGDSCCCWTCVNDARGVGCE